jgi:hypothetical protein
MEFFLIIPGNIGGNWSLSLFCVLARSLGGLCGPVFVTPLCRCHSVRWAGRVLHGRSSEGGTCGIEALFSSLKRNHHYYEYSASRRLRQ